MKVKPLRRCRAPTYPTRLEVLANPRILAENVPHPWRRNALTSAALGAFLTANSCTGTDPVLKPATPKTAIVAPLFEHGEGRGARGCMVLAPPVFLSEEEALQVIQEELAQSGFQTTRANVAWEGVDIPRFRLTYRSVGETFVEEIEEFHEDRWPLDADLVDDHRQVAVEFLGIKDYRPYVSKKRSTVIHYDFITAAEVVAGTVKKKGPEGVYFGTFYEPAVKTNYPEKKIKDFWERHRMVNAESKRLLRLQVKDFVDWLKGQGVI